MTDERKQKRQPQQPPDDPLDEGAFPMANDDSAALQEQLKKMTELAGRAQAELQNAKMRMEREASDFRRYAAEGVVRKLLPTIDNFQRAFSHLPDELKAHEWVKGVAAIEQDLLRKLQEEGLTRFDALGQPVDALRHDVLMEGAGKKGIVTKVFEDGYLLHDKVLRPAKVEVGNGEV